MPGVATDSEQVMIAPAVVWVQVSERLTVWPRKCEPTLVSPVIVPSNCSAMLPAMCAPVGIIVNWSTLAKLKVSRPTVRVKTSAPNVVWSVKVLKSAGVVKAVIPAAAQAEPGAQAPTVSVDAIVLVAVAAVISPVLTVYALPVPVIPNESIVVADATFIQPAITIVAVRANSLVIDFIGFTLVFVVEQGAIIGAGRGASHVPKKKVL
jgi:hypothetical protein